MPGEVQNGMQCAEFDSLLNDALDGALSGSKRLRFEAHRSSCANCAAMFADVEAGMNWLTSLPEVEPPSTLVHRILAETTGVQPAKATRGLGWLERLREIAVPIYRPVAAAVAQPRFAMSFGMAFFSVTMLLNVMGVKITSLRHVDLRPSALVRSYNEAEGRLMHYYQNIRFVYEIETRVRDLKRATTPAEGGSESPKEKEERKQDKKGHEGQEQRYQNYSREQEQMLVAMTQEPALPGEFTAVRRLS